MAADQVALERLDFGWLDVDVGKLAEAGVDAIGGLIAGEERIDDGAGGLDAGQGGGIEGDGTVYEGYLGDIVEGERLTGEEQRGGHDITGYREQGTGNRVQGTGRGADHCRGSR